MKDIKLSECYTDKLLGYYLLSKDCKKCGGEWLCDKCMNYTIWEEKTGVEIVL